MPLSEVHRFVQAQPFVPFRIRLANNAIYDITHPEVCIAMRHLLRVGVRRTSARPFDIRFVSIALIHVAELIPLSPGLVA